MIEFTLKHLEAFVTVAECGRFLKAAEYLYVKQSTVSNHVKSLEESLGVTLFERRGNQKVVLTPEGRRAYATAKRILTDSEGLTTMFRSNEPEPPMQIGSSSLPGQYLLPQYLAAFQAKKPGFRYQLRRGNTAGVHKMLLRGEAHIGFVGASEKNDRLRYYPIAEDRLVMVTPPTPLYRKYQAQGKYGEDLFREPTIGREIDSGTCWIIDDYMNSRGIPRDELNIVARMDEPEAIKSMVMQGAGVSILSYCTVEADVAAGRLLAFDMNKLGFMRRIYLVTRNDITYTGTEKEFIRFVRQYHAELPGIVPISAEEE